MRAPVIRISIGRFDADRQTIVAAKLRESMPPLADRIRAMRGNLGYYAGIDRDNHAMHNVSIWDSVAAAQQMAGFAPMLALAAEFTALGVRFERPILNCETLWQLDGG